MTDMVGRTLISIKDYLDMALSNEDHKDVKHHMGKALANKVKKVTDDSRMKDIAKRAKAQMAVRVDRQKRGLPTSGSAPSIDGGRYTTSNPNGPGVPSKRTAERKGMSKETMSAAEKGDKGGFIRSFMK